MLGVKCLEEYAGQFEMDSCFCWKLVEILPGEGDMLKTLYYQLGVLRPNATQL